MVLEDKLMVALRRYAFSPAYCFSTDGLFQSNFGMNPVLRNWITSLQFNFLSTSNPSGGRQKWVEISMLLEVGPLNIVL